MAMSQEKKDQIIAAIKGRAQMLGIAIEHAAADQIADMKTDARDSVFRGAVFGLVIGFALGAMFF